MIHLINQHLVVKGGLNIFATTGIATAYVGTLPSYGATLVDQSTFTIKFNVNSGVAPTLNINGTGAKLLKDSKGNSLGIGDLVAGVPYHVIYNLATDFYYVVDATGPNTKKYTEVFTGVSTFTVTGTTHGIPFPFVAQVFEINGTTDTLLGASPTIDNTTGDITYTQNTSGNLRLVVVG